MLMSGLYIAIAYPRPTFPIAETLTKTDERGVIRFPINYDKVPLQDCEKDYTKGKYLDGLSLCSGH